jgi:YHS domain-containing protein
MQVSEQRSEAKGLVSQYAGRPYHFCSKPCKKKFNQNPQAYVEPQTGTGQKVQT